MIEAATLPAAAQAGSSLRVALFSGNFNNVVDGAAKALNRLVGHLQARGHSVLVFSPTIPDPAMEPAGEVVSVPSIPLPGSRKEYRLGLGLGRNARRRLDAFAPNLIHVSAPDYVGLSALNYAEGRRLPAVGSFHTRFDTYPRYYGAKWAEKYLTRYMRYFYGRCLHVYAPSLVMMEDLRADRIGRDIRIWSRGVDHALFNPSRRDLEWRRALGFTDEDVLVVFVGRVVLEKGIDVFAEAVLAAAAVNPKIKALVVGDGPERARFEKRLPTAHFTGFLRGEDLARAYASADIFFNPSVTEAFGNVTLEAFASGLPAVCANTEGIVHIVTEGVTGLLSSPRAGAAGYSVKLLELAASPERMREMSRAAHTASLAFDWTAILDEVIAHYHDAIAQHGANVASR
jgi:phosphatidylinositol alpha 1,6-mannosyltransferase